MKAFSVPEIKIIVIEAQDIFTTSGEPAQPTRPQGPETPGDDFY